MLIKSNGPTASGKKQLYSDFPGYTRIFFQIFNIS